jgi:4-diphosphocytidyl-2-C-methyl-D-erythritol kinase
VSGGAAGGSSPGSLTTVRERAPAKVNLLLHVGPRRNDGLHELCSIFASAGLADEVVVGESDSGADAVICPGVEGPNICTAALAGFRERAGEASRGGGAAAGGLKPLDVRIDKRVPVAAGLGGGSADAAAVLRAANRLAGHPLDDRALREVAADVGADVPSQVEPRHALVSGAGEVAHPIELPPMHLVLVPLAWGLSTGDVYREADRIGATRPVLDPGVVRSIAGLPLEDLAASLENDLQAAATALRPEIDRSIAALEGAGALAALVTGSGPTAFGVFARAEEARHAADGIPEALATAIV